jgi:hypothetical protein
MKKYYQIFNNWDATQVEILKSSGLNVPSGFENIKLYDQKLFDKLEPLFKQWGAMVTISSEFSDYDYSNAHHLMSLPDWQTQYPQPENSFAYLEETYDLKNFCSSCGAGAVQKSSFRIQKDIKWGRRKSFILNWVFDEIFVSNNAYEKIFAPIGVDFVPVLLHKTGKVIDDIKQLKIDVSVFGLKLDNVKFERCGNCKRNKYEPITNGYFPNFTDDSYAPRIIKSQEYYGSGKSGSKWIIISQSFRKILLSEKMNFTYYPSSPSEADS